MSEELVHSIEIAAIFLAGSVALVGFGVKFGWKHKEILTSIAAIKTMLEAHIADEGVTFNRIEKKIKKIEEICNSAKAQAFKE
jgi:hypothetical protein